jgi:hypothetical protein
MCCTCTCCSVADPDQGSGAFLTPRSGMNKKSGSGSGMNNLDHIFWVKILNSLMWNGIRDGKKSGPGAGMKKIWARDPG